MNTSSAQPVRLTRSDSTEALAALLGAMLLGAVVIFGVGFSTMPFAHNAAHDVRHASNFPCH